MPEETKPTLQDEYQRIKVEQAKYELEEMKLKSEARARDKEAHARRSKQIAADMKASELKLKQKQEACTHKKGGKNLEGLTFGNDNNYSVIKHTYPNNETWIHCTRCLKTVKPGDKDYYEWLRLPTDNEPSGSVTFSNLQGVA